MLRLLLALLEMLGRKKCLYNFDGTHIANRWYVFFVEDDEDQRLIARLPNAYVHENLLLDTPDGPDSHTHMANTYSLILRGGYLEEVDGCPRYNAKGTIARLRYRQFHRITKVDEGTMTLFMRGWRRGPWAFKAKPCEKVCASCAEKHGACVNTIKETPYALHFGGKGNRRAVQWHPASPTLEKRMARRREAMQHPRVHRLTRDQVNARAAQEYA